MSEDANLTPPVNEAAAPEAPAAPDAEVAKVVAKAKPSRSKKEKAEDVEEDVIVYRSRDEETTAFPLMEIRPIRNPDYPGRHEWHVPASLAERLDRHHHVVTGRVIRVD